MRKTKMGQDGKVRTNLYRCLRPLKRETIVKYKKDWIVRRDAKNRYVYEHYRTNFDKKSLTGMCKVPIDGTEYWYKKQKKEV